MSRRYWVGKRWVGPESLGTTPSSAFCGPMSGASAGPRTGGNIPGEDGLSGAGDDRGLAANRITSPLAVETTRCASARVDNALVHHPTRRPVVRSASRLPASTGPYNLPTSHRISRLSAHRGIPRIRSGK